MHEPSSSPLWASMPLEASVKSIFWGADVRFCFGDVSIFEMDKREAKGCGQGGWFCKGMVAICVLAGMIIALEFPGEEKNGYVCVD